MNVAEFKHAELSLAAYADLNRGVPSLLALTEADMAEARAAQFQRQWLVVDEYSPFLTGLSATIFEEVATGKRYLAIRGSDDLADIIEDFLNVSRLGSYNFSLQFLFLSTKVREWIADGKLPVAFTVTGHSLGGFLASGLTAEFSGHVEHAYLFNAPGLGGVTGFATAPIRRLLGLGVDIDPAKISNLKADAGISPIAGLGLQVAPPSSIAIENQLALGVLNPPAALNHSQRVLTDSLAVYSIYQALDATANIFDIGQLLKRASYRNAEMLESGSFQLGRLFGQLSLPGYENRDALYASLESLNTAITQGGYANAFKVQLLSGEAEIFLKARQSNAAGLAYRYALRELNPFALVGTAAVYADHNAAGRLDLHDSSERTGELSDQWLLDRAKFLVWKNLKFERDLGDGASILRQDSGAETFLFTDKAASIVTGGELTIRVVGGNALQQIDPRRFTFGSEGPDSLSGGKYADHLYGEGGDDSLVGGEGDDYLEGGRGNDTYEYVSADDLGGRDTIFDLDGQGAIVFDGHVLSGGRKAAGNRYVSDDGRFSYALLARIGGDSSLIINDVIEVRNFHNGELGISLDSAGPSASTQYEYHYRGLNAPIDGPDNDPYFFRGSAFNDEFRSGGYVDGEFVPGLIPGVFAGKTGNDLFLGAYGWGGDTASGGSGDDILHGSALGGGLPESDPGVIGDVLYGAAGRDVIHGGPTNDRLFGDWEQPSARFVSHPDPGLDQIIRLGGDVIQRGGGALVYSVIHEQDLTAGSDVRVMTGLQEALHFVLGMEDDAELATLYDDTIEGLQGDDHIAGGPGADYLAGGDGDDVIFGDFDDFYYREITGRNDSQRGFGSYTYLLGLPGDDILDGGEGNDQLTDGYGGNDALFGGPGDDRLVDRDRPLSELLYRDGVAPPLGATVNVLDGGDGDDDISSFNPFGTSHISGGDGRDNIHFDGSAPNVEDEESAPQGQAHIDAGAGDDVVFLIADVAEVKGGAGSDSITAFANVLFVDLADNEAGDHDELHLETWNSKSVRATRDGSDLILSNFRSGEIAVLSQWFEGAEFELDAIVLEDETWIASDMPSILDRTGLPTVEGDSLFAADSVVISAGHGDDTLIARAGPVLLNAGEGTDEVILWDEAEGLVIGGGGYDTLEIGGMHSVIAFNRGDGLDTVYMNGGTISLGGGIALTDIALAEKDNGEGYVLDFGGGDILDLWNNFESPSNPDGASPGPLRLQIINAARTDIYDLRDFASAPVSVSGAAIGGWIAYRYALDHSVAAMPDEVVLDVLNDPAFGVQQQWAPQSLSFAPFVLGGIQNQQAEVGRPFSLTVSENAFIDIDSDVLPVLSLARQNGEALPAWLRFSAQEGRLEGLPGAEDAGELSLRLTATDSDGLSVSELFTLAVGTVAAETSEVPAAPPLAAALPVAPPRSTLQADSPAAAMGPDTRLEQNLLQALFIDNATEQVAAGQQLEAILHDDPRSVAAAHFSQLSVSRDNEFRPIALEGGAAQIAEAADADAGEGVQAGDLPEALFDVEADSSEGADTAFLEPKHVQHDLAPDVLAVPGEQGYGLSSWEVTNALLQFHLEKSGSALYDSPAFGPGAAQRMSGMGFSAEWLTFNSPGFTALPGQLQVFSGLQEGLRSLGEVRIT